MTSPAPAAWPGADGAPIACREKIKVLVDNHAEAAQVLADAMEDALLMGVDEAAMRQVLHALIDSLPGRRAP